MDSDENSLHRSAGAHNLGLAATARRAGQLRNSGISVRDCRTRPHDGRTPQQLHFSGLQVHHRRNLSHQSPAPRDQSRLRTASPIGSKPVSTSLPPRTTARASNWVGYHIRPRFRVPPKWKWPLALSLSNEIGYQRAKYSADTWTWEMRPIIDKQINRWYSH